MPAIYESYAIFAEFATKEYGTQEMEIGLPNRVFNTTEALVGDAISIVEDSNYEKIRLKQGVYHITALSFLTMLPAGEPPVSPVPTQYLTDIYPGYCMIYNVADPPTQTDMSKMLYPGTMGTAYDGVPSHLDCILEVKDNDMIVSLGHQCSYDKPNGPRPRVYLRIAGTDFHVAARMSIFKIA